jgi:hypothetical protein
MHMQNCLEVAWHVVLNCCGGPRRLHGLINRNFERHFDRDVFCCQKSEKRECGKFPPMNSMAFHDIRLSAENQLGFLLCCVWLAVPLLTYDRVVSRCENFGRSVVWYLSAISDVPLKLPLHSDHIQSLSLLCQHFSQWRKIEKPFIPLPRPKRPPEIYFRFSDTQTFLPRCGATVQSICSVDRQLFIVAADLSSKFCQSLSDFVRYCDISWFHFDSIGLLIRFLSGANSGSSINWVTSVWIHFFTSSVIFLTKIVNFLFLFSVFSRLQ